MGGLVEEIRGTAILYHDCKTQEGGDRGMYNGG